MVEQLDESAALARAAALAGRRGLGVLGITGPPGAGKSTLAERVVASVPGSVLVGMDGFHLAHTALRDLGRVERKGAPDTFDAAGYVALLRRVRALDGGDPSVSRPVRAGTVWAPRFHREVEDPIAGEVAVTSDTALVVTEGNYLLLEDEPWAEVKSLLDECWYLDVEDHVRRTHLQARHESYGRTPEQARDRTWGSDEANAVLVAASRPRADVAIALDRP